MSVGQKLKIEQARTRAMTAAIASMRANQALELSIANVRAMEAEAQLAAAKLDADALAEALEDLMAWQNGPPLIMDEKPWQAAMDKGEQALEQHRARGSAGGGRSDAR